MPTLGTTPLNPAAGGANVVTDQQSSGAQMPISELAYSADGVVDSKPVTGVNPLPTALSVPVDAVQAAAAIIGALPTADADVLGELRTIAKLLKAIDFKLGALTKIPAYKGE